MDVRRKDRESFGSLLRRFTRKVQLSGVLKDARRTRFYAKSPTKNKKRESALRRIKRTREYLKLEKLGKKIEEKKGRRR